MTRILRLLSVAATLLIASGAYALGLGEAKVESRLGEPLVARIALNGVEGMNAEELLVSIADTASYERMHIERDYTHSQLQFATSIDRHTGKGEILVTTHDPFTAPFINFVLEVRWPQGNALKSYTLLFEPPIGR